MIYFMLKYKNFMKLFFKILVIFLFATQSYASSQQIGVIGFVIGNVFNQKGEQLKEGDPVYFGDTISATDGSKSQLLFIDETVMTIGSDTKLTIDDYFLIPQKMMANF